MLATAELGTRAVLRTVNPGEMTPCTHCGRVVKFQARFKNQRVIANVYANGRWDRVEIFHDNCYRDAGEPHGPTQS